MRLYERGGYFWTEHGFIEVEPGGGGIPYRARGAGFYAQRTALESLSDAALDRFDTGEGDNVNLPPAQLADALVP
jgi:hypothetical protein